MSSGPKNDYREILAKIEAIRKNIGKNNYQITLPQIVVIGDQSSGKSSLLSEISGISFPNASGITTKCPTVVYTTYDENCDKPLYSIRKDENKGKDVSENELSDTILEYQQEILNECKVSSSPIIIEAIGDYFEDLVLVDLPGIISNGEGKTEVIEMIKKYIRPYESLILTVTEAKQDDETAQALELAKEFDKNEERTIRVLTKFDNFDSEASKQRALKLVSNLENLSPHAIICRPGGNQYSSDREQNILSQLNLPVERAGVKSLKERLPKLLCELIKINLPGLHDQICKVLRENEEKLCQIGEESPDKTSILVYIKKILNNNIEELEYLLTKPMAQFRDNIHETGSNINEELVDQFYTHNAFKCIFFQGEDTFNKIMHKINGDWRPLVESLYQEVEEILQNIFQISQIKRISSNLRNSINNSWNESLRDLLVIFKNNIAKELEKENVFKTMNHYLTSKYQENLILPDEILNKIIATINDDTIYEEKNKFHIRGNPEYEIRHLTEIKENMKEIIQNVVEKNIEEFNREPIEEQHKRRVLAASKANWAVSHKNLIDNIHSVLQSSVLELCKRWVEHSIFEDENIRKTIGEDPKIEKVRKECKENIKIMEYCLQIIK